VKNYENDRESLIRFLGEMGISYKITNNQVRFPCPSCGKSDKFYMSADTTAAICHHRNKCGWTGNLYSLMKHYGKSPFERPERAKLDQKTFRPYIERGKTQKWLLGHVRALEGIPFEILTKYGVSLVKRFDREWIAFPRIFETGEIAGFNYRLNSDSEKTFQQEPKTAQPFFGQHLVEGNEVLNIAEGEKDAMALAWMGFENCVSVPAGANSYTYEMHDFLMKNKFKRINLFADMDKAGEEMVKIFLKKWNGKFYRVELPCKDAQECLLKIENAALTVAQCVENAILHEPEIKLIIKEPEGKELIFIPKENLDESALEIWEKGYPKGLSLSMGKEMDEHLKLLPGQLTIITGTPNSGKSELAELMIVNLSIQYDWKWLLFIPETWPQGMIKHRMISKKLKRRTFGKYISKEEFERESEWFHEHFKIIETEETVTPEQLKDEMQNNDYNGILIDPWNELDVVRDKNDTETEYIRKYLMDLKKVARNKQTSVFLVAHPVKMQRGKDGEYPKPNLFDIAGSAQFYNKADNGLTIWRDAKKNESVLTIAKVKHGVMGRLGELPIIFNEDWRGFEILSESDEWKTFLIP